MMLLLTALLLSAPVVKEEKPPTLLVAPLRAVGMEPLAAQILSEEIRAFVGRSRRYTLVTPEEMAAVDAELARQLSMGCDDSQCISQIGGALGAKLIVTGDLGWVGKRVSLNLKLVDIATMKAVNVAGRRAAKLTDVQDQLASIVSELLGEPSTTQSQLRTRKKEPMTIGKRYLIQIGGVGLTVAGVLWGEANAQEERSLQTAIVADTLILTGIGLWVWNVADLLK
jgi:TolB-like protein